MLVATLAALAPASAHSAVNCSFNGAWGTNEDALSQQVVALTNQHRASIGLGPLAFSPTLTASALWKSGHMAAHGYFSHDDAAFAPLTQPRSWSNRVRDCDYPANSAFGENIAGGYPSAQAVVNGWLNSPGHRANIENGSYKAIGVGAVRDQGGGLWWTQNFGSLIDGGVSPPPPPPDPTPPPVVQPPTPEPPPDGLPSDPAPADGGPDAGKSSGSSDKSKVSGSKLAVNSLRVRAAKIRAGKRLRARMVVRRKAGAPRPGKLVVRCPAALTGGRSVRVVRSRLHALGDGRVRATCVWRLPKRSAGARLDAEIIVAAGADSARIAFAGRVRRA